MKNHIELVFQDIATQETQKATFTREATIKLTRPSMVLIRDILRQERHNMEELRKTGSEIDTDKYIMITQILEGLTDCLGVVLDADLKYEFKI